MDTYSNSEFPLLDSDMADVEDIFIDLMRQRDEHARWMLGDATPPSSNPPNNPDDLRSEWGIPY
jgi:hypothetical protein